MLKVPSTKKYLLLLTFFILVLALPAQAKIQKNDCSSINIESERFVCEIIQETNKTRGVYGVKGLNEDSTLSAIAYKKAKALADNEHFSHTLPDGTTFGETLKKGGYDYRHAGENLAIFFTNGKDVVEAWYDSESHRKNLLNGNFADIGVAVVYGSYDGYEGYYIVQLFGTKLQVIY